MNHTYYLNAIYDKSKSDNLGCILGDMSPFTFIDTKSADPAAWVDWLKSVNKVKVLSSEIGETLTIKEAFQAMSFLSELYINNSIFKELNTQAKIS